ncbi:hypothetical protein BGZ73_003931 [Actinomortierella ambigua]|nr:hypothetical protein BGZ73_003931 [Actinomortierella ambigua]
MATVTTTISTASSSALPAEPAPAPVAREIPGFYYDPEKKRYFKITANHVHGSQHPHSAQSVKEKMTVKPTLDPIVRSKQIPAPAKPGSYSTLTRLLSDRSNLDRAGMIRVQKNTMDASTELTTVMTYSPKRSNVWTSAQYGGRIAIGIDKQLGVLSDDWLRDGATPKLQTYWTGSDVFAVAMEPAFDFKPEIVYAGCRNGLVKVFDLRQPAPQQPKFSDRSPQFRHHYRMMNGGGDGGAGGHGSGGHGRRGSRRGPDFMNATRDQEGSILRGMGHEGSSVHCLQRIGAYYLLTMAMNGEMALWDTRFIGPNSVDFFSSGREGGDSGPVLVPRRPSIGGGNGLGMGMTTTAATTTATTSSFPSSTLAPAKSSPTSKLRTAIPDQLSKVGFCINADQTLVAAPNLDNTVSFWSTRTGQRVHDLRLPSQEPVTQLRFSNDESRPGIWVAVPNQVQWWGLPLST